MSFSRAALGVSLGLAWGCATSRSQEVVEPLDQRMASSMLMRLCDADARATAEEIDLFTRDIGDSCRTIVSDQGLAPDPRFDASMQQAFRDSIGDYPPTAEQIIQCAQKTDGEPTKATAVCINTARAHSLNYAVVLEKSGLILKSVVPYDRPGLSEIQRLNKCLRFSEKTFRLLQELKPLLRKFRELRDDVLEKWWKSA